MLLLLFWSGDGSAPPAVPDVVAPPVFCAGSVYFGGAQVGGLYVPGAQAGKVVDGE